jgi:hypothetical protein
MICNIIKAQYMYYSYKFNHWFFQWKTDSDGDIAFVICNLLTFTKYKEHTLISLKGKNFKMASKYQGYENQSSITQ